MKKTGALLLLLAAMLVAVPAYNTAWAAQRGPGPDGQQGQMMQGQMRGPYHHPESGWQHPVIAPEKQAAYDKIISEYRSKAQPLHNDMWAKRTELNYLSRSDKADPKDISKMVADMKSTMEKCQALRDATAGKLSKDLGISSEHAYSLVGMGACGMGQGGCGMGPGMMGHRGGGYDYDGPRGHRGGHGGWHR